jgi:hypothetical protein
LVRNPVHDSEPGMKRVTNSSELSLTGTQSEPRWIRKPPSDSEPKKSCKPIFQSEPIGVRNREQRVNQLKAEILDDRVDQKLRLNH